MFSSFGMVSHTGDLVYFESIGQALSRLEQKLGVTVIVYGSVARHGCGNDLDLIIVATETMWQKFKQKVLENSLGYCGAFTRHDVAYEMLGKPFEELEGNGLGMVDVYIFPPDWTNRLDELQASFPHEDPNFMRNIATDAKTLGECRIQAARMM